MHIVTTHKGTDFDALASVVAAHLLYPQIIIVLPPSLNPNVRAFLSLHKDLFGFCTPDDIQADRIDTLTVVDTNRWARLEGMAGLAEVRGLAIHLFDHHGNQGDIEASWRCQEEMGANITLMLRYIKQRQLAITPIQASLFLAGLYEDTGNLTFLSTTAEDAGAAAYLLEKGADLHVVGAFLNPPYGRKQKDVLFRMLKHAERTDVDGYAVSINRLKINRYVDNLAVVVQMYQQIMNVDAAFGVFAISGERCLVIGRSRSEGINIAAILRHMNGGGHPGAGSAMVKAIDPMAVETRIRVLIGESHATSGRIRDLMSFPVWVLHAGTPMNQAGKMLWGKGYKGAPVVENGRLVGVLSRRDFLKIKKKPFWRSPISAFMSRTVVTISPDENPGRAARLMIQHGIGRLPVMENGTIVGIFSRSDAVADFYGLCPLGSASFTGCGKHFFPFMPPESTS